MPFARISWIGIVLLLAFWAPLRAQEEQEYLQQFIEIITENLGEDEEFDYTELGEQIDDWRKWPVDINSPEAEIFVQWKMVSDYAYRQLRDHITRNGPLLDMLELQSIPGFTAETIRILNAISQVQGRAITTQSVPLGQLFAHGENEIYIRAGRTIQQSEGYQGEDPDYEGNPDKLYVRLRHRNSNALSYGVTMEKDAGEAFFKGSNPNGFDFYSVHLALQQYRPWLPAVMVGDYTASFGQGLIMHSGFGAGKSSIVTSIKRTGNPLRPFTSVDENNFLRGIAFSIKPADNLTVTLLGSSNKRDANLLVDTIYELGEVVEVETDISSLQTSNLHRTDAEIADENAIDLTQAGVNIMYTQKRSYIGLSALYSKLEAPLNRTPELYNQYYFNGDQLTNVSIDYGVWLGGLHFFGETAMSDNGGLATINGLMAGLDKRVMAAILFRSFDRDYQALSPNVFAEGSLANNEIGLYTGLEITPSVKWKIQLYQDIWSHPWLRYNVDSPSEGQEYFARITYTAKRRLEIYAQFRSKRTALNSRPTGDAIANVEDQIKHQARLHINNMLDKAIQLRSRLEWNSYTHAEDEQHGFLIYQDVVYSPVGSPWTFSGRVTLFDTDDYDSRIYTYENDLIYYYAIPSFSDQGSRFYLNARYKGIRNLTLEFKYAQSRWLDMTTVGSGNDEIEGNVRSEIRMQLIYRFDN